MRRTSIVAIIALLPAAWLATQASATKVSYPGGEAVYNPSCYGDYEDEIAYAPKTPAGRAAGNSGAVAPSPVVTVAESSRRLSKGGGKGKSKPRKGGGGGAPTAAAPAPQAPAAEETVLDAIGSSAGADLAGASVDFARGEAKRDKKAEKERPSDRWSDSDEEDAEGGEAYYGDDDDGSKLEHRPREEPVTAARQVMDWGAKIFLSNDDSMSLASAQRVLYAVANRVPYSVSEVRPHELLNYFSFDTGEPSDDQLFDVLASAEQDGDTLSVALAVKGAVPERQPLDLTMVVDRSCSMDAEGRMSYTKRGLNLMSDQLHDGDRVDLVVFDNEVCTPLKNYVVGRDDPDLLRRAINGMQPRGATDLNAGLQEAYGLAKAHRDTHRRNRRVMLLTDAQMNTGVINANVVSEIGKSFESQGIRLSGIGVGRDFNDKVLDMLTEKGKGAYVYIGSEAVVDRIFGVGFEGLTRTIAHDVQFALQLPDSLAMERFYGEESSTVASDIQPINYYAGTSQVFLQDLTIRGGDLKRGDKVTMSISYRDAVTGEPEKRTFRTTLGAMVDADPHNVRKAQALMAWTDMLLANAMGGDACGASMDAYGMRASGVADDAEVGYVNGLVRTMCGEFQLDEYVRDTPTVAYKVRVDSDIPISRVALSCGRDEWSESLSSSDTIARFDAIPGQCIVTLDGTVAMKAKVEVPENGGDVRCLVRGGRMNCG